MAYVQGLGQSWERYRKWEGGVDCLCRVWAVCLSGRAQLASWRWLLLACGSLRLLRGPLHQQEQCCSPATEWASWCVWVHLPPPGPCPVEQAATAALVIVALGLHTAVSDKCLEHG